MSNNIRWIAMIAMIGALLLAAAVGFWAYQAGVAHGIEQSGKIVVPPSGPYPYPYPYYGWHRPWGFGFFFVPLFGLPIARKLVQAHGGDIRIASTPGQGTEVTISLPR